MIMVEDKEKIQQLEAFRMEIKEIAKKISETDATIAGIVDVNELDAQDMEYWQETKNLLLAIDKLDPKSQTLNEDLKNLKIEADELAVKVKAVAADSGIGISKNYFAQWLNNRNPLLGIDVALRFIDKGKPGVERLKEMFSETTDMYVKGGYKK